MKKIVATSLLAITLAASSIAIATPASAIGIRIGPRGVHVGVGPRVYRRGYVRHRFIAPRRVYRGRRVYRHF